MNDTTLPPVSPLPPAPPVQVPPPVPPRRVGTGFVSIVLGVAALFAVGGVAFAAGRMTAPPAAGQVAAVNPGANTGNGNGNGFGFGRGNGNGVGNGNANGGPFGFGGGGGGTAVSLSGTVTAVASDHLTIQLAGGQTVDIPVDSSTAWHSQAVAAATDVTAGSTVRVTLSDIGRGPNASPAPSAGASSSPNASGATGPGRGGPFGGRLGPASDVTITGG